MKRSRIISIISMMVLLTASSALSQVGLKKVGQSTMNFQLVSISPRASAMGEAFYAVGKGAESIFFNPGGVVESGRRFDLKLYITRWIADINYIGGAVAWNMGNMGTLGLSFLTVDYGTIHATGLLAPGEQELYPQGYKDFGIADNVGAYSFGVTYGRAITNQFLIGGTMRLAGQSLGRSTVASGETTNDALKLVFDAGVKYYTGLKSFRFGMAIRNFSSTVKREEIEEQMPILFTMGAAMDLLDIFVPDHSADHTFTLAVDFLHPNNYSERVNFGLEYMLFGKIALRGGYQMMQDIASWSAGIGMNTNLGKNEISIDYSYSNFDIFSGVNRLSVGMAF